MKTVLMTLAFAASAVLVQAQPEGGTPPNGPRPGGPGGPEGRRPVPPLFAALDADKNGELSAGEIANAATALKALDKDGDGKISKEELRPPMPPRDSEGKGDGKGEGRPPREGGPRPEGGPRKEGGPRPDGAPREEGASASRPEGGPRFGSAGRREGGPRFEAAGRPDGAPRFGAAGRPDGAPRFAGPRREGHFRPEGAVRRFQKFRRSEGLPAFEGRGPRDHRHGPHAPPADRE